MTACFIVFSTVGVYNRIVKTECALSQMFFEKGRFNGKKEKL